MVEVDAGTKRVLRTVAVPGRPHNLTVSDEGTVVASLPAAGRVALLRRGRPVVVALGGSPHDVKLASEMVVVTNEGSARLDLLAQDGRVLGHVPLEANPHDVAIAPGGGTAWVSLDGTDRIAVVDLRRRAVRRYLATGRRPHDLLFGPDGRVWVTDWNGGVFVYSPGGILVREVLPGTPIHHLTFDRTRRRAWLTDNADERIFVLDSGSLSELRSFATRGAPHHAAVTADGRWALVADNGTGRLLIYDSRTLRPAGSVAVGSGPHGVWSVPAT